MLQFDVKGRKEGKTSGNEYVQEQEGEPWKGLREGNKDPTESQRPRGENFKEKEMVSDVKCCREVEDEAGNRSWYLETWRSLATFRKKHSSSTRKELMRSEGLRREEVVWKQFFSDLTATAFDINPAYLLNHFPLLWLL